MGLELVVADVTDDDEDEGEEAAHHQHYTIDLHIDEHVADASVNVVLELDLTLSELPEENEGLECLDEEHCGNHELLCRQIL